jgi:hypothetical protein
MICLYFNSISLETVDGIVCKLTVEHRENFRCNIVDGDFGKRDQTRV